MNEFFEKVPRIAEFLKSRGFRKFTFSDINHFLADQSEKELTVKEKFVLISLVDNHFLFKGYRKREKSVETIFWLGVVG